VRLSDWWVCRGRAAAAAAAAAADGAAVQAASVSTQYHRRRVLGPVTRHRLADVRANLPWRGCVRPAGTAPCRECCRCHCHCSQTDRRSAVPAASPHTAAAELSMGWVGSTIAEVPKIEGIMLMHPKRSWLGSRVVSVLDSGAEGPGFKSQSRRCRVTVLGKLFTPIVSLFTKQQNW